jgi:anti-sigma factor RsiW
MITCQELVDGLCDFLTDDLWPPKRAEFDLHLARCPSCTTYVKTYRETVEMAKAAYDPAVYAPEVPETLIQAILAKAPKAERARKPGERGVG